jgi:hypothetical protein
MSSVIGVSGMVRPCAAAAQTRAGTVIQNVASASYQIGEAGPVERPSNIDRVVVGEQLDVTLVATGPAVDSGGRLTWPVTLRNTGNGSEAFALLATAPTGSAVQLAIDVDGDGKFDAARDRLLDAGSPSVAPGESLSLLMLVTSPSGGDAGAALALAARAITGSGTPGTVFAGLGDGGGDAVVGPTGAAARVSTAVDASAASAPQLIKSQVALAPDGTERAVSGTIVTYSLEARFAQATPAARIEDTVPDGTTLIPGSIQLDGAALSDAADGDPGAADARGIAVALGDIPGPAVRRVQFKVRIR